MCLTKSRIAYWDNIKGFLIILTVFAHILFQFQNQSDVINSIVDYIYLFHMPAFVFVSGYFGKKDSCQSFESIIKFVFLYFIFNSIMGFIYGFNSLLTPLYSYWYLIALVAWRITARYLAKFKEINLILVTLAIFVGFFPSIDNTFAIARIIGFYPFYMAGYLLSEEKSNNEIVGKRYTKRLLISFVLLLGTSLIAFFAYNFFSYADSDLQMGAYIEPLDAFGRIIIFVIAFLAIQTLRYITPDKKIPLITMFGKNSLWIFLLHRPFTLIISDLTAKWDDLYVILFAFICTLLICLLFGNGFVCKYLDRFAKSGASIFTSSAKKITFAKIAALSVALWFVVSFVITNYSQISFEDIKDLFTGQLNTQTSGTESSSEDVMFRKMSNSQKEAFDNSFRITFSGDLILLEDQVKRAYNGVEYNFDDVFEYAKGYIESADLAIGVFEGPLAGEDSGYTTGNFDDKKELYLNFPDEFAFAVKNAGFDLVTTANNHLLDKGVEGAKRTLDVLDKIGLDHTGSYRNESEKSKNHVKIIEQSGIKIAVLSYTYGSNYYDTYTLGEGELSYLTSVISGTEGEFFEELKSDVERDFEEAKMLNPDLIIVLPHIGTQFSNEPDAEQEKWFSIFKENGADIILGDHPHAVQPVLIEKYDERTVFTAYCPGNFANIYRENQGDTSTLIDVFIDRTTKQVVGGAVVPLYTQSTIDGNYRALPINEIENNDVLRKQLSTDDMVRAQTAYDKVTEVVLGNKMNISGVTERLYFDDSGYLRVPTSGLALDEEMKSSVFFKELEKADSVCFIGDSVTEGTKNGGCPWYEPIEAYFQDKKMIKFAKGGCTVSYMTDRMDEIPKVGLYVVALGTNDVRYRDHSICAMTSEDYIVSIDKLSKGIMNKNKDAKIIFIAPWYSTDGDIYSQVNYADKLALNSEYSNALERYCKENELYYINANDYIKDKLDKEIQSKYLLDHIHPNSSAGVLLYTEAVLRN